MTKSFLLGLLAASSATVAYASPSTYAFDSFGDLQPAANAPNTNNGYLTDTNATAAACNNPQFGGTGSRQNGPAAITSAVGTITRSLSVNVCNGLNPISSQIGVNVGNSGALEIINGVGDRSVAAVRYNLGTNQFLDEIAAYNNGVFDELGFAFEVIESDGNDVEVYAYLNGDALGQDAIGANFAGQFIFYIDPSTDISGTLDLVFVGAAGYDIAIDGVGLYINDTTAAPAPAAFGLFGLGLVGLGLARRRG